MPKKTLARALRDEIERRGITQNEAASEMGILQQTLGHWLLQDAQPGSVHFDVICKFLGIQEPELGVLIIASATARDARKSARG